VLEKKPRIELITLCGVLFIFLFSTIPVFLHKESQYMFNWPQLELTDYERNFVRPYKTVEDGRAYEGVLPRIYHRVLTSQALPNKNLPSIVTSAQIQISRRARIFALAFTGNVDRWGINIATSAGTQYTQKLPRSNRDGIVSAMFPGTLQNVFSNNNDDVTSWPRDDDGFIGPATFGDNEVLFPLSQPFPELIEPNWLIQPNETVIFSGTPYEVPYSIDGAEGETYLTPVILHIYAYVWEFPGMTSAMAHQ
jgi:hypothetical protein